MAKKWDWIDYDDTPAIQIEPLHEVRDLNKFNEILTSMKKSGWIGRPLLLAEGCNGLQALTGSHRLAAAKSLGMDALTYILDSDLLETFCEENDMTLDEITYFDEDKMLVALEKIGDKEAIEIYKIEREESL